jgi:hypothetical protein
VEREQEDEKKRRRGEKDERMKRITTQCNIIKQNALAAFRPITFERWIGRKSKVKKVRRRR